MLFSYKVIKPNLAPRFFDFNSEQFKALFIMLELQ